MRYPLTNRLMRERAKQAIDAAQDGDVCEVKERSRTLEQNAALHAMLTDISRQAKWGGKSRDVEFWKVLMVSGHRMVRNEQSEVTLGIEGEMVQLRESTARMGVKKLSELIEYVSAWATSNGVRLSAPEREFV